MYVVEHLIHIRAIKSNCKMMIQLTYLTDEVKDVFTICKCLSKSLGGLFKDVYEDH